MRLSKHPFATNSLFRKLSIILIKSMFQLCDEFTNSFSNINFNSISSDQYFLILYISICRLSFSALSHIYFMFNFWCHFSCGYWAEINVTLLCRRNLCRNIEMILFLIYWRLCFLSRFQLEILRRFDIINHTFSALVIIIFRSLESFVCTFSVLMNLSSDTDWHMMERQIKNGNE